MELLTATTFELLSGLIGTIIGAILAYIFAQKQFNIQKETDEQRMQLDTALAFLDEFVSDQFAQDRRRASKILRQHIKEENLDKFYPKLTDEQKQPIIRVLSFFRRLQLTIQFDRIDTQIVLELLSGEFIHWYYVYLKNLVPSNWSTKKHLIKLNDWLVENLDGDEYEYKKKKAEATRKKRIEET